MTGPGGGDHRSESGDRLVQIVAGVACALFAAPLLFIAGLIIVAQLGQQRLPTSPLAAFLILSGLLMAWIAYRLIRGVPLWSGLFGLAFFDIS